MSPKSKSIHCKTRVAKKWLWFFKPFSLWIFLFFWFNCYTTVNATVVILAPRPNPKIILLMLQYQQKEQQANTSTGQENVLPIFTNIFVPIFCFSIKLLCKHPSHCGYLGPQPISNIITLNPPLTTQNAMSPCEHKVRKMVILIFTSIFCYYSFNLSD